MTENFKNESELKELKEFYDERIDDLESVRFNTYPSSYFDDCGKKS